MTKIAFTNNETKWTLEGFDAMVAWLSEGAKSVWINREALTAEIRHEVRGAFGWETVTVIVSRVS